MRETRVERYRDIHRTRLSYTCPGGGNIERAGSSSSDASNALSDDFSVCGVERTAELEVDVRSSGPGAAR